MKPAEAASRRGVTLIEMLVGVAILGVVLAAAIPSLSGMLERRRVIAAAGEIASIFAQARSESASLGTKVNVHLEPVPVSVGDHSCMILSTQAAADTCRCDRPPNRLCKIGLSRTLRDYRLPRDSSVTFTATADWGSTPYVVTLMKGRYLNDATGDTNNVQVTVVGTRTQAKLRVDYINSGRVRTCSPDGSIGGFPVCGADAS
ncbi:MAG TPA: prepilin-type N-terminal cleavage/methylation domain-containing protein [Roseateles sp.]